MLGQTVAIYRNQRTGAFRIQPCARAGGIPQEFGPHVVLPPDASAEELLRVVMDGLPKTDSERYVQSLAPKYPPEEYRRMLREEQLVHVERSNAEFKIVPSKKMRNSFGSIDEMTIRIAPAEFLKLGGSLILQAFKQLG